MEYRLLGPFEAQAGDDPLQLGGSKQRGLLAVLALNANRVVSRERLIDALWGDRPPPTAVESVQVYVSRLRKLLPAESLLTRPSGYLLRVEPDAVDILRFERLVAEARSLESEHAADAFRAALGLWRGPPLAEFDEPFAAVEAARLEDARLAALEDRLDADFALGRHAEVVGELEGLVSAYPYRERLRAQLMLALYRSDRQAEALAAYRDARAMLDELGVEPSRRLRALEKAMLTQDPALDLKPTALPPNRRFTTNLPRVASTFVGRDREVAELTALIRCRTRFLTVTGPGGSGKTRLAIEAVSKLLAEFEAGVCWVGLSPIRDAPLVSETIARNLGAEGELIRWIGTRRLLLLLDNFEQVVDAAPNVADLVEACPNLHVVATSRERLRVRGESEYPALPLETADAVELFATRAGVEPDQTVAELCRRLDNLPLALELAAARTAVLTPAQIVERLSQRLDLFSGGRDADARQQTLRATIGWSYDLLDPAEARLFGRFAIFQGATLEAAEQVADATLATLQSLVDKNLLRHSGERFWMHETIREYAHEALSESGEEEAVAERHLCYFLNLIETTAARNYAGTTAESLTREWLEADNLRRAFDYCSRTGRPDLKLRMAAAGWRFWLLRGQSNEGRRWLDAALATAPADAPAEARAEAVFGAAELARVQGDHDQAWTLMCQARDLATANANSVLARGSLAGLALIAMDRGELAAAPELLDAAIELAPATGDMRDLVLALGTRGYLALALGDYANGVALCQESFELARGGGSEVAMAAALINIGFGCLELGDRDRAATAFRDSVELSLRLGYAESIAYVAVGQAALCVPARMDDALSLLAAAGALLASLGLQLDRVERRVRERTLETLRANLPQETIDVAFRDARALTLDQIAALTLASFD
jgi:predicted ATPase/DNA-binding SARP family transcriptional activator